ncbi:MAG TPA: single-stranded DNA-binding protein [Bryobacteraceae bacterium]|nr:single-stranded DNA-binding protein [Bryobacteraceae bacterium]
MVLGFMGGMPELKFTGDGKPVAKFRVAVNEKWKDSAGATRERVGWACRWGRIELVELFLQRGADPAETDAEPWAAPRAWAERMGHAAVAALLR